MIEPSSFRSSTLVVVGGISTSIGCHLSSQFRIYLISIFLNLLSLIMRTIFLSPKLPPCFRRDSISSFGSIIICPLCFNSNYPRAILESVLHLNASGIYFLSGFNQIGSNISVSYSLPKFLNGREAQISSLSFHTMVSCILILHF